ncbi:MAG: hypothetical protein CL669_02540 [Balneola sp.]|nr:hypothetical protein [Balneola sp.]
MVSFRIQSLIKHCLLPVLSALPLFLHSSFGNGMVVAQSLVSEQPHETAHMLSNFAVQTHIVQQNLPFELSPEQGFYTDSVELRLLNKRPGWDYYFNVQGKKPVDWVFPEDGITLKASNAIRILAIQPESQDTVEGFFTYLLNQNPSLPVLSLIFEPGDFFSWDRGIYVKGSNGISGYCRSTPHNWNQDWERPIQMTLFEQDGSASAVPMFSVAAGVKIGGGCTRLYDQKSLDIYFRSDYGLSRLNYPLFPDKPITEFNRLSLRNGGQDWYRAMIRNAFSQELIRGRMDLGYQSYKHVAVYFNGQYWGIHTLREKQNEDFIESNYGVDADAIDLLSGNASVGEGSAEHYEQMLEYVNENGLEDSVHYAWIQQRMDVEQYMDYLIVEIFLANGDWPANNIKYWRTQSDTGKWRWILYDADMTMDSHSRGRLETNMFEKLHMLTETNYEHPTWSTLLMRKLLENSVFRASFIQRYSVHLHLSFNPGRSLALMDSIAWLIADEVPDHMRRWSKSMRLGNDMNWDKHLEIMRTYLSQRPDKEREHIQNFFGTGDIHRLSTSVNRAKSGTILVEGARSDTTEYVLLYKNIPAQLRAIPAAGYRFVHWEGLSNSNSPNIQVTLDKNSEIQAIFEPITSTQTSEVVINEIHYNASPTQDSDDWVELHNPNDYPVDLSYWFFSDSDDAHRYYFAPGSLLAGGGFRVLMRKPQDFIAVYPTVTVAEGPIGFGLAGSGELLRLFNAQEQLVDSVRYDDESPWPTAADGQGASLALVNSLLDNAEARFWSASSNGGTPGEPNLDVLVANELDENPLNNKVQPYQTQLGNNYPNPFNPITTIPFSLEKASKVRLTVYDMLGRSVRVIIDEYHSAGTHEVHFSAGLDGLSSGLYMYSLEFDGERITKAMLLLK